MDRENFNKEKIVNAIIKAMNHEFVNDKEYADKIAETCYNVQNS